ncbi:MAG TPA: AI-2E family transporter [Polyangiaceae bacterium]|nr:AI-2E family transporter [Polyangiaceae bacterium]
MASSEVSGMSEAPPLNSVPELERHALRERSFHWCVVVLSAGAVLALLPFWAPLLLASWLAIVVAPWHAKLARKVGGRSRAAGVVTVLVVVALLLPLLVIGLSLLGAGLNLVEQLRKSGGMREVLDTLLSAEPSLQHAKRGLPQIVQFAQSHGKDALAAAGSIAAAAAAGGVGLFIFLATFYTCLVEGRRAHAWLLDHSPLERWQTLRLSGAYAETARGLLIGVGMTALLQSTIATVGYVIVGVPQAFVLGLMTGFAALIPSIGTGLIWLPLAIGLFVADKTGMGVAVLVIGSVNSLTDNFATPVLSRYARVDLHTFVLLVAILGGIAMFGPWGLLAGPLLIRLALEALRMGRERRELGEPGGLIREGRA